MPSWMIRHLPQFGGAIGEDPLRHVQMFHSICGRMKPKNESLEGFKLKCFKFSLTDHALSWYDSSCAAYEDYYVDLRARFLEDFSPPSLRLEVREKLSTLTQFPDETLYEYYVRFDTLQGSCPHHGFSALSLLNKFLGGMTLLDHCMLDDAAGGSIMDLSVEEIWDLIDDEAQKLRPRRGPVLIAEPYEKGPGPAVEETKTDPILITEPAEKDPAPMDEPAEEYPVLVTKIPPRVPSVCIWIAPPRIYDEKGTCLRSRMCDGKVRNSQAREVANRSCTKKRPRHGPREWKPGWRSTKAQLDGPAAMVFLPTRKDVKAKPPDTI